MSNLIAMAGDAGSRLDSAQEKDALDQHNERRGRHQNTPDLVWSDELAYSAQRQADANALACDALPSGEPVGENMHSTTGTSFSWTDVLNE